MQAFQLGFLGCLGVLTAVVLGIVGLIVLGGILISSDESAQELISGDASDISVRIEGTRGIPFTGAVGSVGQNRNVDGTVPASFSLEGEGSHGIFTALIQKLTDRGTLRVTLMCRDGARTSETTASYGLVSVTCTP